MGRVVSSIEELEGLLKNENDKIRSYIIFPSGAEGVYLIHNAETVDKSAIPMYASPILF